MVAYERDFAGNYADAFVQVFNAADVPLDGGADSTILPSAKEKTR